MLLIASGCLLTENPRANCVVQLGLSFPSTHLSLSHRPARPPSQLFCLFLFHLSWALRLQVEWLATCRLPSAAELDRPSGYRLATRLGARIRLVRSDVLVCHVQQGLHFSGELSGLPAK